MPAPVCSSCAGRPGSRWETKTGSPISTRRFRCRPRPVRTRRCKPLSTTARRERSRSAASRRVARRSWRCNRTSRTIRTSAAAGGWRRSRSRRTSPWAIGARGCGCDEWLAESERGASHSLEPHVRVVRAGILGARGEVAEASRELAIAVDPSNLEGEASFQSLARAAFVYLGLGRGDEASTFLSDVLGLDERMIRLLNDSAIVDAAWTAHDLGRAYEYAERPDPGQAGRSWLTAARAICAGDFRAAAETCEAMGYRPGEAYARLRYAGQLVEEGRRGEADVQLQRSLAFWREVGA